MIDKTVLDRYYADALETPVIELVAFATAFMAVTERILEKHPDSSTVDGQLVDFLVEVADIVEGLLP